MGGVWERQIRTIKKVLFILVKQHSRTLNDESFVTLMTEVEGIVNSRPLTADSFSNPNDPQPLTPMQLLTMKTNYMLPPPGAFNDIEVYSRRRWRHIQHLANEFWSRWRKEYLQTLHSRQRWAQTKRNFTEGDVVMMNDETTTRNKWPIGVIVEAKRDEHGLVRMVKIRFGAKRLLERPISKIILLYPHEGFSSEQDYW